MTKQAELLQWAKLLENDGFLNFLEGNVSIIDREKGVQYITPSGKRKNMLSEDDIAVMDLKTGEQVGGNLRRSSEYLLHEAALRYRPDCNASVHSHADFLTAYACIGKDAHFEGSIGLREDIPCIPVGMPGTMEITNGLEEALKKSNVVLLGNHGVLVVDKDLESACANLTFQEHMVKIATIVKMIGEPPMKLSDELKARIIEMIHSEG